MPDEGTRREERNWGFKWRRNKLEIKARMCRAWLPKRKEYSEDCINSKTETHRA
jgi:hypothetical protein